MFNKGHKNLRWLSSTLYGHFSLWSHSLRATLMMIFIFLMTYMLAKSTENEVAARQFNVHMGETLFSYANTGFNLIMTSVALMVMMSELPKQASYQNYVIMRVSRKKWLLSLVTFCMAMVFIFVVLMLCSSAVFSLPFVTPGHGWSDLERLAEDATYAFEIQYVSQYIRVMSPAIACILASVILYLFWLTMTLVILLFSLCGAPNLGVITCVSMVLLNITILFESLPGIKLPSHFATLASIASQVHEKKIQYVMKAIAGYLLLDVCLVLLMGMRVKYMDIRYIEKE